MGNSFLRIPRILGSAFVLCMALIVVLPAQGGSIYVSNQYTGQVDAYDLTSGAYQGQVGIFNAPTGLTMDSSGKLYINELGTGSLLKFDPMTLNLSTFLSLPGGATTGPFSVAFDASNNAYVSALNSNQVFKFDSAGVQQGSALSLNRPRGITYSPADGNLYLVSTPIGGTDTIYKLSTGLSPSLLFQQDASHTLSDPRFLLIDGVGDFQISNTGPNGGNVGTGFIETFQSNGTQVGQYQGNLSGPNEMYLIGSTLYFTDFFSGDVTKCNLANSPACSVFITNAGGGPQGALGLVISENTTFTGAAVPEPATFGFLGLGLTALAIIRRRRHS